MGELVNQEIAKKESACTRLFESLIAGETFMTIHYDSPKDYVKQYWDALERAGQSNFKRSIFEYIIYSLLIREGIRPFYIQAHSALAPLVNFDVLFYCKPAPISLSLKTSLREYYKQADLEANALKYVHPRSKSYLLTMETKDASALKGKILSGDIIGLDEIIDCNTDDINRLIANLKQTAFAVSEKIEVVQGNLVE